jgi:hypothetical protein
MLLADRELAREHKQASAAITAARLIGSELHGMFIERRERGRPADFSGLTDEELDAALVAKMTARGMPEDQAWRYVHAGRRARAQRSAEDPLAPPPGL